MVLVLLRCDWRPARPIVVGVTSDRSDLESGTTYCDHSSPEPRRRHYAGGTDIPQASGRGCYGYVYNPATGQREIEPYQPELVRRIFTRFSERLDSDYDAACRCTGVATGAKDPVMARKL